MGVEGLPVARANERTVVRVLYFNEGIEILPGREDLPCRLGSIELAAVTPDRLPA